MRMRPGKPLQLLLAIALIVQGAVATLAPPDGDELLVEPLESISPPSDDPARRIVTPVQVADAVSQALRPTTAMPAFSAEWTGRIEQRFRWRPGAFVMVAGYPTRPSQRLELTGMTSSGRTLLARPMGHDPTEAWRVHRVEFDDPEPVSELLVTIRDEGGRARDWVAVTAPFTVRTPFGHAWRSPIRLTLALLAAWGALLLPGCLWRGHGAHLVRRLGDGAVTPGLLLLGLIAAIGWGLLAAERAWCPGRFGDAAAQFALIVRGLGMLLGLMSLLRIGATGTGSRAGRTPPSRWDPASLAVVVSVIALGRVMISAGPAGELFGGAPERTFEVGDRSDPRLTYATARLAWLGIPPGDRFAKGLFHPWSFADRGPLAGLFAAGVISLTGATPEPPAPADLGDRSWRAFDQAGNGACRAALIALNAASLILLAGVIRRRARTGAAVVSLWVIAATPFFLHELIFAWPKLAAGGYTLLAADRLARGRVSAAAIAWSIGFLLHPLALLFAPVVAFGTWMLSVPRRIKSGVHGGIGPAPLHSRTASASLARVALFLILATTVWWTWRLGFADSGGGSVFFQYPLMADGKPAGDAFAWLASRLGSLANTLVPMHLWFVEGRHPQVNALAGRSPTVIPLAMQVWTSLPLAVGLTALPWLTMSLIGVAPREPRRFLVIAVFPLAWMLLYWGYNRTGLMREGLHPWFLALIPLAVGGESTSVAWTRRWLWLLPFESVGWALLPTLVTGPREPHPWHGVADAIGLGLMLGGMLALSRFLKTWGAEGPPVRG